MKSKEQLTRRSTRRSTKSPMSKDRSDLVALVHDFTAEYGLDAESGMSEGDMVEILLFGDTFTTQTFCDENPGLCGEQELWKALFEQKFPDLYLLFREVSVPFTTEGVTGIVPGGGTTLRTPLFWRDCYFDLHNMPPEMTKAVEELVNGEVSDAFLEESSGKMHKTLEEMHENFWSISVVLANLDVSRGAVFPTLFFGAGADLLTHIFFPEEMLKADAVINLFNEYLFRGFDLPAVTENAMIYLIERRLTNRVIQMTLYATQKGYNRALRLLLDDHRVDKFIKESKLIYEATKTDNIETVRLLLGDKRANPAADDSLALQESADGHPEILRLLLEDKRADPTADNNAAAFIASDQYDSETLKLLLDDGRADPSRRSENETLRAAMSEKSGEVLRILLENGRANPGAFDNRVIIDASAFGSSKAVSLLLKDKRVDPAARDNDAIIGASESGKSDNLRLLLDDKRTDPGAQNSSSLNQAALNGWPEAVRMLLADERVDPTAGMNLAIRNSVIYMRSWDNVARKTEVVRLLLEDGRANPADMDNQMILTTVRKGHTEILALLLKDKRANPSSTYGAEDNAVIRKAFKEENVDMIRLLLEDGRADPAAITNDAIKRMNKSGDTSVVLLLAALAPSFRNITHYRMFSRPLLKDFARLEGLEIDVRMGKDELLGVLFPNNKGENLTLKELRLLAKERNVRGRSKMRKKELKEALFGAQ